MNNLSFEERFARNMDLHLDLSGILFVEAARRIDRGTKSLAELRRELKRHADRISSAQQAQDDEDITDAWVDVIQGVGGLESRFAATVSEFSVADVLLVAAAEAYVNAVAAHVLPRSEFEQFDRLSPVGKWLFLPKAMKLKWKLSLDKGCLQHFAALVGRRNRVVHPRIIRVHGIVKVESFLKILSLDVRQVKQGLKAVADLIRGVSRSWRGSSGPDWLDLSKATDHPPCFYLGNVEAGARLGRPGER